MFCINIIICSYSPELDGRAGERDPGAGARRGKRNHDREGNHDHSPLPPLLRLHRLPTGASRRYNYLSGKGIHKSIKYL